MNDFGFNFYDAQLGIFKILSWGLFFGFFVGLVRFLVFNFVERKE